MKRITLLYKRISIQILKVIKKKSLLRLSRKRSFGVQKRLRQENSWSYFILSVTPTTVPKREFEIVYETKPLNGEGFRGWMLPQIFKKNLWLCDLRSCDHMQVHFPFMTMWGSIFPLYVYKEFTTFLFIHLFSTRRRDDKYKRVTPCKPSEPNWVIKSTLSVIYLIIV